MRRPGLAALALVVALGVARAEGQEAGLAPGLGGPMSLAELDDEIARREADLERYGERLERLEADTAGVAAELDARAEALREREGQVRARIVTLCRLSQGGTLHLLRGAASLTDLVRRARYVRALADHDLALLAEHQREVEELERRRAELDHRVDEQRQLRERLAAYRDELAAERERRAAAGRAGVGFQFDPAATSFDSSLPRLDGLIGL